MKTEDIQALEKEAELNDGHCSKCSQTIKIYRYKVNRTHAQFLKAMAKAVRNSEVNDVDVSTIGIPYSTRTQSSKIRQHGLIARIKNASGAQIPRHWLITKKGWAFLNGQPIPEKVVVFNNQVLGHDGHLVTIHEVLGEQPDPDEPPYEETPVSTPEARAYEDVRKPRRKLHYDAAYIGHVYTESRLLVRGTVYSLELDGLAVRRPISVQVPAKGLHLDYPDIAHFQRDWKIVT